MKKYVIMMLIIALFVSSYNSTYSERKLDVLDGMPNLMLFMTDLYEDGYVVLSMTANPDRNLIFQIMGVNNSPNGSPTTITGTHINVDICSSKTNGDFVISFDKSGINKVEYYRYSKTGTLISTNTLATLPACANLASGCRSNYPNFCFHDSSNNTFIFGYLDRDSKIIIGKTDADISSQSYNFRTGVSTTNLKQLLDGCLMNDGFYVVVWTESTSGETDSYNYFGAIFNKDLLLIKSAFQLNTQFPSSYTSTIMNVSALIFGGFVVVSEENPIPNTTNKIFLWARVFNVSYERTNEIKLSNVEYDQFSSSCSLRDGGFLVSYRNYENSNIKVYMARYDSKFSQVDDKFENKHPNYGSLGACLSTSNEFFINAYSSPNFFATIDSSSEYILRPTCIDLTVNIVATTTTPINFSKNIFPNSSTTKITFTSQPNSVSGSFITSDTKTTITLNTSFLIGNISYVPGSNAFVSVNYFSTNDTLNSPSCKLVLRVCYISCGTCVQVGNASQHRCSTCGTNYFPLPDATSMCYLSTDFISGYGFATNSFIKCISNCNKCANTTQCTECLDGYFVNTSSKVCDSCKSTCKTCSNGTECLTCKDGLYYHQVDNQCYSAGNCPSGFYNKDGETKICETCKSTCKTCVNGTECLTCNTDLFYHQADKQCYENGTCPNGFFSKNGEIKTCDSCTYKCKTCSNSTLCQFCFEDSYFNDADKQCYDAGDCPYEFYNKEGTIKTCDPCISNCKICSNSTECITCNDNAYFYPIDKTCFASANCPYGYFKDDDGISKKCSLCIAGCKICSNSTQCITCNDDYFFNQDDEKCYAASKCPFGYYNKNGLTKTCDPCTSNCKICSNSSECITCDSNFYYFYLNRRCYSAINCPFRTFPNDGVIKACLPCTSNCSSCTKEGCTACDDDFYFNENDKKCYEADKCPYGYYNYEENQKKVCKNCTANCDICSNSNECEDCDKDFYFHQADKQCYPAGKCPTGFYSKNGEKKTCETCRSNCAKCTNNLDCLKCQNNYLLNHVSKTCHLETCPDSFYSSVSDDKVDLCMPCKPNCQICTSENTCIECAPNFFWSNSSKECVEDCGKSFFKQILNGKRTCENCNSNCQVCTNANECSKCNDLYFLRTDKKCYVDCLDKFYGNTSNNTCDNCPLTCSKCVSLGICQACETGNYLLVLDEKQSCVPDCPVEYFTDASTAKCYNKSNYCLSGENICQNGGKCIRINEEVKCECLVGFIGILCERSSTQKTPEQNDDKSFKYIESVLTEIKSMIDEDIPLNPNILDIANNSIMDKINLIKENNINNLDLNEFQKKVDSVKNSVSSIADVKIKSITLNEPSIFYNELFTIIISTSSTQFKENSKQSSLEKNLSILESDECEKNLRRQNNIPDNLQLLIKQIEFSPNLNVTSLNNTRSNSSSSLIYEYFDPRNDKKLDTKVCSNAATTIKSSNPKVFEKLSINKYMRLKKEGLDMFDPFHEAYKTRCFKFKDLDTNKDTTPNYRIKNYYGNKKISCMESCKYSGVDENAYVICECPRFLNGEERIHEAKEEKLTGMRNLNFDILKCSNIAFKSQNVSKNPAFYILGILILLSVIITLGLIKLKHKVIKSNLKQIIKTDCLFYNRETFNKYKYFSHNNSSFNFYPRKNMSGKVNENINLNDKKGDNYFSLGKHKELTPAKVGMIPGNVNNLNEENPEIEIENKDAKIKIENKKRVKKHKIITQKKPPLRKIDSFDDSVKNDDEYKYNIERNNLSASQVSRQKLDIDSSARIGDNLNDKSNDGKLIYNIDMDIYKKYPYHSPTIKDYQKLSLFDSIQFDKRSFCQIFCDNLIEMHIIIAMFYKASIFNPVWMRTLKFFFYLSLILFMNSSLFTDNLIDQRVEIIDSVTFRFLKFFIRMVQPSCLDMNSLK